jgi:hypothetical protein
MPKYQVTITTTDYRQVTLEIDAPNADAAEATAQHIYGEEDIAWTSQGTLELDFDVEPSK